MPLRRIQQEAMATIAANRHPGSHIAGGTVINMDSARYSDDIDIFNDLFSEDDRVNMLRNTVEIDAKSLIAAGFEIRWATRHPEKYQAIVTKDGESTLLDWVIDSDYRFFESIPDDLFGFKLHMFDLATNKLLAAASRKEPRDVLDLLHLHKNHFPLGAAIWAAPAKDPGYTPESLIEQLGRNAVYRQDDFDRIMSDATIDAREVAIAFRMILAQAAEFVGSMPAGYDELAFLKDGQIIQPDPARLSEYESLQARRQAHWPSSPEIGSEMIAADLKR